MVFLFTPFFSLGFSGTDMGDSILDWVAWARPLIDVGAWGLALNVVVFVVVSRFTTKPPARTIERWAAIANPKVHPKEPTA